MEFSSCWFKINSHIPNVALVNVSVFEHFWTVELCTLGLYVRAHAQWTNIGQTYLDVVLVIIGGVVAEVVVVWRRYRGI